MLDQTTLDLIKKIDDYTTAIGNRIQAFINAVVTGGGATAQEINDALGPEVARLQGLASDPVKPIPTV